MGYVYTLTHSVTGKVYVGSTDFPVNRYRNHLWALRRGDHPNKSMQKDFDEYGGEFSLHIVDTNEDHKEQKWMAKMGSWDPERGYNIGGAKGAKAYSETDEVKQLCDHNFPVEECVNEYAHSSYQLYSFFRDRAGFSDYSTAKRIGISVSAFHSWRRGRYVLKIDKMAKIADLFGVSLSELIGVVPHK